MAMQIDGTHIFCWLVWILRISFTCASGLV